MLTRTCPPGLALAGPDMSKSRLFIKFRKIFWCNSECFCMALCGEAENKLKPLKRHLHEKMMWNFSTKKFQNFGQTPSGHTPGGCCTLHGSSPPLFLILRAGVLAGVILWASHRERIVETRFVVKLKEFTKIFQKSETCYTNHKNYIKINVFYSFQGPEWMLVKASHTPWPRHQRRRGSKWTIM